MSCHLFANSEDKGSSHVTPFPIIFEETPFPEVLLELSNPKDQKSSQQFLVILV